MTTALYVLAVLTPLVLACISLGMIGIRWIERRAEDRVRAEHGLPPRPPRPSRRIEDAESGPAARAAALRRRLSTALDADAGPAPAPRSARRPPSALPWPLQDLGPQPAPDADPIRVMRARPATAEATPEPPAAPAPVTSARVPAARAPAVPAVRLPPTRIEPPLMVDLPAPAPDRDVDGARAALARAAATLQELERAADRADRYGTKECPACDRSVRLSARVCPHCRHRMAPEPEPGPQDVTAV